MNCVGITPQFTLSVHGCTHSPPLLLFHHSVFIIVEAQETRNERFLPEFPSSLLSGYSLNTQTGHGRERDLVRGQFSLYREWYGRLMYNTYPIPTETPRLNVLS